MEPLFDCRYSSCCACWTDLFFSVDCSDSECSVPSSGPKELVDPRTSTLSRTDDIVLKGGWNVWMAIGCTHTSQGGRDRGEL